MGLDNKVLYVEQQIEKHNRNMDFLKNNLSKGDKAFVPKLKIENDKEISYGDTIKFKVSPEIVNLGFRLVISCKINEQWKVLYDEKITNNYVEISSDKLKDIDKIIKEIGTEFNLQGFICGPKASSDEIKSNYCQDEKGNTIYSNIKFKPVKSDMKINLIFEGKNELNSWDDLKKNEFLFKCKISNFKENPNLRLKAKYDIDLLGINYSQEMKDWKIFINDNKEFYYYMNNKKEIDLEVKKELDLLKIKFEAPQKTSVQKIVCTISNVNLYLNNIPQIEKDKNIQEVIKLNPKEKDKILEEEVKLINKLKELKNDCESIKKELNEGKINNDMNSLNNLLKNPAPKFEEVRNIIRIIEGNENTKGIKFHALEIQKKLINISKELLILEKTLDSLDNKLKNYDYLKQKINKIKKLYLPKQKEFLNNIEIKFKEFIDLIQKEKENIEKDKKYEIKLKEVQNLFEQQIKNLFLDLEKQSVLIIRGIEFVINDMENIKLETEKELGQKDIPVPKVSKETPANIPKSQTVNYEPPKTQKNEPTSAITDIEKAHSGAIRQKSDRNFGPAQPVDEISEGIPKTETQKFVYASWPDLKEKGFSNNVITDKKYNSVIYVIEKLDNGKALFQISDNEISQTKAMNNISDLIDPVCDREGDPNTSTKIINLKPGILRFESGNWIVEIKAKIKLQ